MNHVAHCLLSYPDEGLLIGNFIGDFVKGSTWKAYPERIQKGILLHRFIDAYTEEHPALRASVQRIRPYAGRFAAPVADILYDHLLSVLWETESITPAFEHFAHWTYTSLDAYRAFMPERLQQRWPDMLAGRFLHLYRSRAGIAWTLERFAQRLSLPLDWQGLLRDWAENEAAFAADFRAFFPDLQQSVAKWYQKHVGS